MGDPINSPGDSSRPDETLRVGFNLTLSAIGFGSLMLTMAAGDLSAGVDCLPFTFGPLGISLLIAWFSLRKAVQVVIGAGSAAYFAWFLFIFCTVYFGSPDANASLAFLFVGIYALPVMIIVWIIAMANEPRFWQQA